MNEPVLFLPAPKTPPRRKFGRTAVNLALFGILFFGSLASGNIFLQYSHALAEDAKIIRPLPPIEVSEPLFATFENDFVKVVAKMSVDGAKEFPPQPFAEQKIGIYIHMNNIANANFLAREIAKLEKLENPAIVFDVKGSFVYFDSDSAIAEKYGLVKSLYDLPEIIEQFDAAGIYSIARVIALKDPELATRNSEVWLNGKYSGVPVPEWVNPTNAEVLEYNREIIGEIVAAGVDEINLDFMRYPDKYTSAFLGLTGTEKIANILDFVKMARTEIKSQNPSAVLSVNTFAILAWDFGKSEAALGQDIRWLAEYADIIAPMLYPATFSRDNPNYFLSGKSFEYSTVFLTLEKYKNILGADAKKLRPWIQGYYATEKQIRDQIDAVADAGVAGFTVWDIQNDYSETYKILAEN
jgi:hypothetical protein